MATPASVRGHPIHAILVPLPIGLWVFSLASDVAYRSGAGPLFNNMAFWTMAGGLVGAVLAAVPGLVDLLSVTDQRTRRVGIAHLTLNSTVVGLFLVNLWLRLRLPPERLLPFALSIIAVALLAISGWLGGVLVYELGMGVPSEREIAIRTRRKDHAA
jgi:uncharacterized membrane protein